MSDDYKIEEQKALDIMYDPIAQNFSDEVIDSIWNGIIRDKKMNNNQKAALIRERLCNSEYGFSSLGTGTNRTALLRNGRVFKIALDYYGIIDNRVEFLLYNYERYRDEKGEKNIAKYLAITPAIEERGYILEAEYYEVLDDVFEFEECKDEIIGICKKLQKSYFFDDVGYRPENYKNFAKDTDGNIVIIDFGYLKPKKLIDSTCPTCKIGNMEYNKLYTKLKCNNCEYVMDRPFEIFKHEVDTSGGFRKSEINAYDFETGEESSDDESASLAEMFLKDYPIERIFKNFVTVLKENK